MDVPFVVMPEHGYQPAYTTSGSQRRQRCRRGRSAGRFQDGTGAGERRDSGRERGRSPRLKTRLQPSRFPLRFAARQ